MPKLIGAEYILDYLFKPGEIGIVVSGGMGAAPLTHADLVAWQVNTETRLTPWECRSLVALSNAYLAQKQKSEARDCLPPWTLVLSDDEKAEHAEQVAARIKSIFRE